jgi:DNA-binding NarL/FixJ family response regulator
MNPIRVLIADDHALVRAGIRALVEKIEGMVVVGEAGKGSEALELVRELRPDLMLLDITMPDGGGFDVLDQVNKKYPEIRIIVLTVHEAGEYAIRALREGAAGFLPKSAASTELEQAIQAVVRGEVYISPETSRKTLLEYGKGATKRDLLATLSPRQREVLRLIAEGRTTKQIAQLPAVCCCRRTLRASSGHLVLAEFSPGFWFHSNRTLLSWMLFSGRGAADVAAGEVTPGRLTLNRKLKKTNPREDEALDSCNRSFLYLAVVLYIGIFAFRRAKGKEEAEDYFLASRSLGPFVFLFSLFGTNMTAFAILGSSGHAFTNGIVTFGLMASSSGLVIPLTIFLIGTRVWALGKKYGFMTPVQMFRDRWECSHIGTVIFVVQACCWCLTSSSASWAAAQRCTPSAAGSSRSGLAAPSSRWS